MEIAALVCNQKLNYESALQTYSIYKYARNNGNQIQIIDCNYLDNDLKFGRKKVNNEMLYKFLEDNVVLTSTRYKNLDQVEDNPPLADKYVVANAFSNDLDALSTKEKSFAYGIKDLDKFQLEKLHEEYNNVSVLFNSNEEIKRVVDPLFLLTREEWLDFAANSKKEFKGDYIVLYGENVTSDMLTYAKNLSENKKMKVYVVADSVKKVFYKGKRLNGLKPYDLVNLLYNAQEVVTSSEDAIKLSVLFERGLHIFREENGNDSQIETINDLKLLDRIVTSVDRVITKPLNYKEALDNIDEMKENSVEFF